MTSALLPGNPVFSSPLTPFGWLYFYAAGTTTPQAAYSDSTGSTPLANPLQLDSNGQATFWLKSGLSYKINLVDVNLYQQPHWPVDNILADPANSAANGVYVALAAATGASLVGFQRSETGAVGSTVSASEQNRVINVKTDFGAKGDGVTDDTAAINAALATNKSVYFPLGVYQISSDLVFSAQNNTAGAGRVIFGESMGDTFLAASGVFTGAGAHGSVIRQTSANHSCFYNTDTLPYFTMRDLCLVGGPTTDRGIYCTGTAAQCLFQNLNIYMGKQAIYLPQQNGTGYGAAFANTFINCHGSSWTTSVFEMAGGPGTNLIGCYAHDFPGGNWIPNYAFSAGTQILNGSNLYICTVAGVTAASGGPTGTGTGIGDGTCVWNYVGMGAPGIAGFRIYFTANLYGCNCVDLGGNGAIVGQYIGALNPVNGLAAGDSVNTQCFVAFNGCNFENYSIGGVEVRGSGTATLRDCTFVPPNIYTASVIQNTPISNSQPIVIERCQVNNGYAGAFWQPTRYYVKGAVVQTGTKLYLCSVAGTSAGSGGPSGTATSGIVDGSCTWGYVGPAPTGRTKRSELYVAAGASPNFMVYSTASLGAQPQADFMGTAIADCGGTEGLVQADANHMLPVESGKVLNGPLVLIAPAINASGVSNGLVLGNGTQTTVGAAGGASALPATPLGYFQGYLGSTPIVVPYFKLS